MTAQATRRVQLLMHGPDRNCSSPCFLNEWIRPQRNRRSTHGEDDEGGGGAAFGRPLTIEEVPCRRLSPGEVLVKVIATGVCHTDLHAADGDWPVKPALPFIPGHEGAGS